MENEDAMQALADNLWQYFQPKIQSMSTAAVTYFRAKVVGTASGGRITVQRPFETTTLSLPYVSSISGAGVGTEVTVLVLGSMSNAIIIGNGTLSGL